MSGLRFRIDLFVPLDSKTEKVDSVLQTKIDTIKTSILDFRQYSQKINPGKEAEEDTTKAVFHKCYHDETPPKPCEADKDISEWTKDSGPVAVKIEEGTLKKVWNAIKKIF